MVQSSRQVANRSKLYGTLEDSLNKGGGVLVYACFYFVQGNTLGYFVAQMIYLSISCRACEIGWFLCRPSEIDTYFCRSIEIGGTFLSGN